MPFCTLGKDLSQNGSIQIDNIFMSHYLPSADALDVKVYLYGLFMAYQYDEGNTIERISMAFKINEERVLSAYEYWEIKGLVSVSKSHPIKITYHSPKLPLTPVIKLNAREYSTFVDELARLFPEKLLIQNQYEAFITLMKEYKIEINAMLMIISYCLSIRPEAGVTYIIALASDWAKQGITSETRVNEHIANLELNNEDIRTIFTTLGLKTAADLDDRELYLKWTKQYNLTLDAILTAARTLKKKGGMSKLSKVIDEFINAGATTAKEIADIYEKKENNTELAKLIVTALGIYYSSFDMIIETYLLPWQAKGFDREALITIAKFCFTRNVKSLDGMNNIVEKFCKLGLLTSNMLDIYIKNQQAIDSLIKEVLEKSGSLPFVTNRDRELYSNFVNDWGFSHDFILLAASLSVNKPFPMSNISRLLATLKEKGITKLTDAENYLKNPPIKQSNKNLDDFMQQTYTKEQHQAVFKKYTGSLFDEEDDNK